MFVLGSWEHDPVLSKYETLEVSLCLDTDDDFLSKKVGEISRKIRSFCFKGDWNEEEKDAAMKISGKVSLRFVVYSETSKVYP